MEPLGDVVFLFDEEDGFLFWMGEPGLAHDLLEDSDDPVLGFDALARPLRVTGGPEASIELESDQPDEDGFRSALARHYVVHARGPRMPDIQDLPAFVEAVLVSLDED
jgi:hypothetical protein